MPGSCQISSDWPTWLGSQRGAIWNRGVLTCCWMTRGGLAHRETGKFPGGPLPNYKFWSCKLVQIVFTPNVWPGNVNVSGMPCFRCYVIPPVGSNKAPTLAALVADCRRLPQRCSMIATLNWWSDSWIGQRFSVFLLRCCCYKLSHIQGGPENGYPVLFWG